MKINVLFDAFFAADTFSSGGNCTVGILVLSFQIIDLAEIARRARETKKKQHRNHVCRNFFFFRQ
jgi:hypothetical protein